MRIDNHLKCAVSRVPRLAAAMRPGLMLLLEASECAKELRRDVWEFAVELEDLRRAGLTATTLRWLVGTRCVEHAIERTRPEAKKRSFGRNNNLAFPANTCFVLTETGVALVRKAQIRWASAFDARGNGAAGQARHGALPQVPTWDKKRRELRLGELVVKRFPGPAPNQENILAALEEEHWPARIDDPLPGHAEQDPKERLHDAIKNLNRHQFHPHIRFHGDGTGCGVVWTLRPQA